MKVVSVVGARPQFIKASPVSRALRTGGHREFLLHTGQHYDREMSRVFFEELEIPRPDANLGVGSGSHARQTGEMLVGTERVLVEEEPDWVLVYGDTNSTLAGALAAAKLDLPVAHVEAGLRSHNRTMPEEHNRVLTDHASDLLLCPTENAVRNLEDEGLASRAVLVGDPMYDVLLELREVARRQSALPGSLGLEAGGYAVATVHRAYNADVPERLADVFEAFRRLDEPVVLPLHPRTRRRLEEADHPRVPGNVRVIDPLGYLDMLALLQGARIVLTDSGGLQKEAFWLSVPCVTLRPETEWVETVEAGWNVVAGTDPDAVVDAATGGGWPEGPPPAVFGEGDAGRRIVSALEARS